MQHYLSTNKLSDLVHSNYFLLPVLNRFGIRLGFNDKTVQQVCIEQKIDINFFLAIVNTYSNSHYFPEADLLSFSPVLIVDYLRKTHKYYFEHIIPEIERRLERLLTGCSSTCNQLNLIKSFYNKYKTELARHLTSEDETVFPYVIEVTKAVENSTKLPDRYKKYSISKFQKEHSSIDQKVFDLKNLLIKYLEPNYNDNDANMFLNLLFQFERDLIDHARIEDKVLVTKVLWLEKQLNNE